MKKEEKFLIFKRRAVAGSSSMFYITSHFDVTLFACFSRRSPALSSYDSKKKKKKKKKISQEKKKKPTEERIKQRSVGVSQHTGTGSTGSGSLLLGHYVIR